MASGSEATPFLADNEIGDTQDEIDGGFSRFSPAASRFRRPITVLACVISFLSISIFGLLVASYVFLHVGPFENFIFISWGSEAAIRNLSICLFVNFLLTAPTIFFQIPSLINVVIHMAMSIVILVFSAGIFGSGWPGSNLCRHWPTGPNFKPQPDSIECTKARADLRTMMGISAGVSIFIVVLILATLVLRLVALFKTKSWEGQNDGALQGSGWGPNGFTVQFNLSILPNRRPAPTVQPAKTTKPLSNTPNTDEGPLIET